MYEVLTLYTNLLEEKGKISWKKTFAQVATTKVSATDLAKAIDSNHNKRYGGKRKPSQYSGKNGQYWRKVANDLIGIILRYGEQAAD